jgi:sugar (pentulose or hexulose) kinase
MTGLSLGIDIGTSGIRTAVLDETGKVISSARTAHEPQSDDFIDAESWWRVVQACIVKQNAALTEIGHAPTGIVRIGVDGTSGTMVLTDADLAPVTSALMYNSSGFDAEATSIAQFAPQTHITRGSNSALARALRLQLWDNDKHARHLLHQADFIIAKLRGQGGFSDENNTLKLGFDPAAGAWPDWLDQTGLNISLLPQVLPAGAPIGSISKLTAANLGLSRDTMVHAGTTDSIAAFLAAAPLKSGVAVTSLGTTLAIKILSETRIDDPTIGLYSHKLGDFWLAGGASNTGGGVLAKLFSSKELTALSHQIDPDVGSPLDYYPLLKPGERFPFNDPSHPVKMTPRPSDNAAFLHGILESIARIEVQCYRAIEERGGDFPTVIFTAGGGASNDTWTKIRARILGVTPTQADETEAAIGVARLVMQTSD